jgi:hypothetical protein
MNIQRLTISRRISVVRLRIQLFGDCRTKVERALTDFDHFSRALLFYSPGRGCNHHMQYCTWCTVI